jgi:hypothetical protein
LVRDVASAPSTTSEGSVTTSHQPTVTIIDGESHKVAGRALFCLAGWRFARVPAKVVKVTEQPSPRDPFAPLLPYVGQHTDNWVARWALITSEVSRRAALMGLESAVRSVRDDLDAGRL